MFEVDKKFLREGVPSVVHDAVVVVSEAEGVDLLRGQLVEVVLLSHHHVLTLYLNPVVSENNLFSLLLFVVWKVDVFKTNSHEEVLNIQTIISFLLFVAKIELRKKSYFLSKCLVCCLLLDEINNSNIAVRIQIY